MEWYQKVLTQHYADFSGRARRQEYWMFVLVNILAGVLLNVGGAILGVLTKSEVFLAIPALYSLAVLIPSLAVSCRRLHDTGRSGWYLLCAVIPLIGPLVLLYFMVGDSVPGNNEYGPNPKGI